jgi:DNA repair photolyase
LPPGLEKNQVTVRVALLSREQIDRLPKRAREVVEYRKSGLSLNHIQGCPLDCAYCIRHTYGLWDQRIPRALMSDAEAVEELVNHRYFQPHVTPVQVFNRATDPFLPAVRPHTFAVLEDLDERGLTNHVLVITRHSMKVGDAERLSQLRHVKVTLLFTYSGIDNKEIEPYPSSVAAESLKLMSAPERRKYRTILYWRSLVPGLNDTDKHLAEAHDAVKLTGVPDPSSRLHLRGAVDRRRSGDQRTFAAQLRSNGVAHGGGCRCPALRTFGHSDVSLRSDHRDGRARPGTRTETRCPWAGSPTACTSRSSAAGAR